MRTLLLLVSLTAVPAFSQSFHPGLKVGIPLTVYFDTGAAAAGGTRTEYSAATRRYVLGASGELRFPGFALEGDVLFHRMGYVAMVSAPDRSSAIDIKGDSWDFALLLKHRRGGLYLGGGPTVRYAGPVRGLGEETVGPIRTGLDTSSPPALRQRFYPGVTACAGTQFGSGRLVLAPEVQYTRWISNISVPGGLLRFAPNQVELLAGLVF